MKKQNKLAGEKSPYLLQHAGNPVDWYPWSDAAFEKAKKEDKPIFLSIGYSTCHWCHVMEKESFEDKEVSDLMNRAFVSIKVDREERPDIDNIYMSVCQMITGSGGWPLTIIMTPDLKPFFAATYIPKETRFGRSGLLELIPQIEDFWKDRRKELLRSAKKIVDALKENEFKSIAGGTEPGIETINLAYRQLMSRYDEINGGFGDAPKFPSPHNLMLLIRYWKRSGEKKALMAVEKTLAEMRCGGIYDHLGFGFHRYSTDSYWLVPHFEKMLYDQALMAITYIEFYQATGKEEYAETAREILNYVLRDMKSHEGGFYSAEDADSEGEEGKFYIWSLDEIISILGREDSEFVKSVFNLKKAGNYIDPVDGDINGFNILHNEKPVSEITKELGMSETSFNAKLSTIRSKLFKVRLKRTHPHKDDKILTDWNGLMIAAFALVSRVLDEKRYEDAAVAAVEFIEKKMLNPEGRLLHRFREGEAAITAQLDDYAFLIWGMIELYETTFNKKYLDSAIDLNNELYRYFWDVENAGYFLTPEDGEELLFRPKTIYDGAVPSGNSVMFLNLLRLSKLNRDNSLETRASTLIRAFGLDIKAVPVGHAMMLAGLDFALGPTKEVMIKGNKDSDRTREMIKALNTGFFPNKVVLLNPEDKLGSLKFYPKGSGISPEKNKDETKAYVCVKHSCKEPTSSVKRMLELLEEK